MTENRAIQMKVVDRKLQAYLQRYPFASGPDLALNQVARDTLAANISFRPAGGTAETIMLSPKDALLAASDADAVIRWMDQIHLPPNVQAKHMNDFGWKVKDIPRSAKQVLVLGCGDGVELLFLRGVLPEARIVAIDYYDSLLPGVSDAVRLEHKLGDMNVLLGELSPEFDLVFSNHTLEHSYAPDDLLKVLRSLLVPGGLLVSAVPMCACAGSAFFDKLEKHAEKATEIHPLDAVFLDAGHPWKTNPSDISATVERAGFCDLRIYQRSEHVSRPLAVSRAKLEQDRKAKAALNTVLLGIPRWFAKVLLPRGIAAKGARWYFALERRLPFGTNNIMNVYCEEGLFYCRRD